MVQYRGKAEKTDLATTELEKQSNRPFRGRRKTKMYEQDNQDNQDNQDEAKRGINEFMEAVIDGDKEALRVVKENAWEFMQAVMGETQALSAIVDSVWGYESHTEDEGKEELDDTAWDVSLWDFTPTATEDEGTEPAPRFPPTLKLWREAHPNAFVFDDEDEEWVNNTTPTEADGVAPYSFPMPYPEDLDEDLYDEDANEDFSIGWRYYPAPENKDAWIAVAPSRRALNAYIRDGRILLNNPKVIRVSYRR